MSSEKRLILTMVLTIASVYGIRMLMERTGLLPPPKVDPPEAVAQKDPAKDQERAKLKDKPGEVAKGELPANPFAPEVAASADPVKKATVPLAKPSELVIGSDSDEAPDAYHLRLLLDQRGAVVAQATSAEYGAEFDPKNPTIQGRKPRLRLIDDSSPNSPGSLAVTVVATSRVAHPANVDAEGVMETETKIEAPLDAVDWEVIRDKPDAPAVRAIAKFSQEAKREVVGQEIAFRTTSQEPYVEVTKVYRIWKGEDGFEVELKFSSPSKESKFTYRLFGPHGIPIEGEWYTSTFRDVFFGQVKENATSTEISTRSSTDVVKYKDDPSYYRLTTLPLKYSGVEDQYFATLVAPWPSPKTQQDRLDLSAEPFIFGFDPKLPQKADIGVEIDSKPLLVGPNLGEISHKYRVFAGPKTATALAPYEAVDLASYRKQYIPIPGASWLAQNVIAPLLDRIYLLTQSAARLVGWKNGNFGIAIILLTMTVRMIMFPLGRKQAMMAKKMQDLQPVLAEVKEKYKDDKEALTRETMAVWKRHKVNPAAGCLPALIQMPIFVGLWQALNNSVALRQSPFLFIRDLAAPDMIWKFPTTIPFLGDYLNILPFLVVSLMLVQTKLFSPPPTTPEAEMNQKMMKYMMIFMAFMFYKVPSGLGLYFITSSLWQICERLLLPKVISNKPTTVEIDGFGEKGKGPGPGGGNGKGPAPNGGGAQGWLGKRLEKLFEEAAKDKTIRNNEREPERDRGGRERERDRSRTKPRPGPGKKR